MFPSYVASPIFDLSLPKRALRPSELRNRNQHNQVYINGYPGYGNIRNQQYEDLLDSLQFPCDDDFSADSAASSPEPKYPQTKPMPVNTTRKYPKEELKKEKKADSRNLSDQIFVLMLHTQLYAISSLSLEEALQKYVVLYINNGNLLSTESRKEKVIFKNLKNQHDKLTREEWNFLCYYINQIKFDVNASTFLSEFAKVLNREQQVPSSPSNNSPNNSDTGIRKSLLSNSLELISLQQPLSEAELIRLYICVQFSNYKELWDSDSIILRNCVSEAIDQFLSTHPKIDSDVLNALLATMNPSSTC